MCYLLTADGPAVEGLELEVQLGIRAAKKLLKEISFADSNTPKVKVILQKMRKILEGEQRNSNSSFFSYNKLFSPQSTSSHSLSSSSSVYSSNSHLSRVSQKVDLSKVVGLLFSHYTTVCPIITKAFQSPKNAGKWKIWGKLCSVCVALNKKKKKLLQPFFIIILDL